MKTVFQVIGGILLVLIMAFIAAVLWLSVINEHDQRLVNEIARKTIVKDSVNCPNCGETILINRNK